MPAKDSLPAASRRPPIAAISGLAILAGIAFFSYGFWLAWHPLGFIFFGLSLAAIGFMLGRRAADPRRRS